MFRFQDLAAVMSFVGYRGFVPSALHLWELINDALNRVQNFCSNQCQQSLWSPEPDCLQQI